MKTNTVAHGRNGTDRAQKNGKPAKTVGQAIDAAGIQPAAMSAILKKTEREGAKFLRWLKQAPKLGEFHQSRGMDESVVVDFPIHLPIDYWMFLQCIAQSKDMSLEDTVYELLSDSIENFESRERMQAEALERWNGATKAERGAIAADIKRSLEAAGA